MKECGAVTEESAQEAKKEKQGKKKLQGERRESKEANVQRRKEQKQKARQREKNSLIFIYGPRKNTSYVYEICHTLYTILGLVLAH